MMISTALAFLHDLSAEQTDGLAMGWAALVGSYQLVSGSSRGGGLAGDMMLMEWQRLEG